MKIIVALDNEAIKEELEKRYINQVYNEDFRQQEKVIEYLSNNHFENTILITKDSLEGNLNGRLYIKHIRLAYENIKVIYFVEKLDNEYKKFLFSNEVFNIIEGNYININNIFEIIDENKFMVYRILNDNKTQVKENSVIAVYGTNGAGKSLVASFISKKISTELLKKIAVLDFNLENPSLDIINNIEVNSNIFEQIVKDIDNSLISNMEIKDYLINDVDNKNNFYLTSNLNILELRSKDYLKYYEFIINKIKNEFENVVIDLPSQPFLDITKCSLMNADKVIFVINPNYVSIRQAKKYLDIIYNLYDISKDKIGIVINKVTKNSLDNIQIKSLLRDYKIVLNLDYNSNVESMINGELENVCFKNNYKELFKFLNLQNVINKSKNIKTLKNIVFNKKSYINV